MGVRGLVREEERGVVVLVSRSWICDQGRLLFQEIQQFVDWTLGPISAQYSGIPSSAVSKELERDPFASRTQDITAWALNRKSLRLIKLEGSGAGEGVWCQRKHVGKWEGAGWWLVNGESFFLEGWWWVKMKQRGLVLDLRLDHVLWRIN
jgi:hypothetical protein